ncbi:MAG TPA: DUF2550 domain-containing protein [Jiangellales bacterium]|nr:DUF2550 domain-containing protein [Jiangellales bacterium]
MSALQVSAATVVALVVLVVLGLVLVALRRRSIQRGGGFDMCVRQGSGWTGGWVFGVGRLRGDDLEWFRTFSPAWRPSRVLSRRSLSVEGRRVPGVQEAYDLPAGHEILRCLVGGESLELSLTEAGETAFLAWLDAAPPGEHLVA